MKETLKLIRENCQFSELPEFVRNLYGGDINEVYLILVDREYFAVKENDTSRFPGMLDKEFRAMEFLRKNSPLYYPEMIKSFTASGRQYLVMEYVEEGNGSSAAQSELGRGLAVQHRQTNAKFGWEEDNYIGSLQQPNEFIDDWNEFYAVRRLIFQSRMAFDAGLLSKKEIKKIENLCGYLDEIIPIEPPALLHGDLWSGNYFISKAGKPVLYDPAVYWGHREIDIAMTKLFGGFSSEFYSSYQDEYPLEKNWEERIPIFQLYPYLVHLNLFGGSYFSSVQRIIKSF